MFIIAEVGSNWESLEDCIASIIAAKLAGADAVKFQLYTHKELYGYDGEIAGELPREWVEKLYSKCEEVGIEFMCTAFSAEGYDFIDPFVKRHKIASAETTDISIRNRVWELDKPILVSSGGSSLEEMVDIVKKLEGRDVSVLYCVSSYPAKNIDFRAINRLARRFHKVGYSCHSDEWLPTALACRDFDHLEVLEKHFKIRDMNTPDNGHSILPSDFSKMVATIKNGYPLQMPHPTETDFIKYTKRRYIVPLGGFYRTKNNG